MNEQNPTQPAPVPAPPPTLPADDDTPTIEERLAAAEARAEEADAKLAAAAEQITQAVKNVDPDAVTRYAVYDTTFEKFVGQVVDRKPTPAAAKKLVGHDGFEIREV